MIRSEFIRLIIGYVMLLMAQVLIFKDIVLFKSAFCFVYLLIFLPIPKKINPILQLLLGFITGLIIDSFYNTQGIHAVVSTFIMFIRPFWIKIKARGSEFDLETKFNIKEHGLQWFIMYAYPLIFIHHLLLFNIEASNFTFFWSVLGKAFSSSLFTLLIIVMMQYLFTKKEKY